MTTFHSPAQVTAAATDTAGRYVGTLRLCATCLRRLRPYHVGPEAYPRCPAHGQFGARASELLALAERAAVWGSDTRVP